MPAPAARFPARRWARPGRRAEALVHNAARAVAQNRGRRPPSAGYAMVNHPHASVGRHLTGKHGDHSAPYLHFRGELRNFWLLLWKVRKTGFEGRRETPEGRGKYALGLPGSAE